MKCHILLYNFATRRLLLSLLYLSDVKMCVCLVYLLTYLLTYVL